MDWFEIRSKHCRMRVEIHRRDAEDAETTQRKTFFPLRLASHALCVSAINVSLLRINPELINQTY